MVVEIEPRSHARSDETDRAPRAESRPVGASRAPLSPLTYASILSHATQRSSSRLRPCGTNNTRGAYLIETKKHTQVASHSHHLSSGPASWSGLSPHQPRLSALPGVAATDDSRPASPAASARSHATMRSRLVVDVGLATIPLAVCTLASRKRAGSPPRPVQGARSDLRGERTMAMLMAYQSDIDPDVIPARGLLRARLGHQVSTYCQTRPIRGITPRRPGLATWASLAFLPFIRRHRTACPSSKAH